MKRPILGAPNCSLLQEWFRARKLVETSAEHIASFVAAKAKTHVAEGCGSPLACSPIL